MRGLLEQGVAAGEFRKVDPALFYISLNGACDNLFYGRQINARFLGAGGITDEVRRQYIRHMTTLFLGGLLTDKAAMSIDTEGSSAGKR